MRRRKDRSFKSADEVIQVYAPKQASRIRASTDESPTEVGKRLAKQVIESLRDGMGLSKPRK